MALKNPENNEYFKIDIEDHPSKNIMFLKYMDESTRHEEPGEWNAPKVQMCFVEDEYDNALVNYSKDDK